MKTTSNSKKILLNSEQKLLFLTLYHSKEYAWFHTGEKKKKKKVNMWLCAFFHTEFESHTENIFKNYDVKS